MVPLNPSSSSCLSSFNSIYITKLPFFFFFTSNKNTSSHPFAPFKLSYSLNPPNEPETKPKPEPTPAPDLDPVKLAFEKSKAYKKLTSNQNPAEKPNINTTKPSPKQVSVSSINFVGLDFGDNKRKTRSGSIPPGLVPITDPFPEQSLQEVEIIVGDSTKLDTNNDNNSVTPKVHEEGDKDNDVYYKPKVSTWGVFPRPGNISKTFGGGRTIQPGDVLETPEEKAAKEARTRQLLAAYKKKIGLNIDPKLKSECEEALKNGDVLMNAGKLKEAIPYYEKVMESVNFKSELHGLAALQWSICMDSLNKSNEARVMYEKLQSHPNGKVNKKARQFIFSFQAMEMMKFNTKYSPFSSGNDGLYRNYFDAFVENRSNVYKGDEEGEGAFMDQALPYIFFLASPIFLLLVIVALQRKI